MSCKIFYKVGYFLITLISINAFFSCSSSDESVMDTLEVSIISKSSISLFETITLDGSKSKGKIKNYEWNLLSVPASVKENEKREYETEINTQTESIVTFFPGHTGSYEIKLTIADHNNDKKSDTYTFNVNEICDNSFIYNNLIIEKFDSTNEWTLIEGLDTNQELCGSPFDFDTGYYDIGNGYLEIWSGYAKRYLSVKKDLSNISIDENKNYRFKISIEGRMYKPYLHADHTEDHNRTNFSLRFLNQEIHIRFNQNERAWWDDNYWPISELYYFSGDLDIYVHNSSGKYVFFVCNEGINYTNDLEMIETNSQETSISFIAHCDDAESDCFSSNKLKITEFKIDEF